MEAPEGSLTLYGKKQRCGHFKHFGTNTKQINENKHAVHPKYADDVALTAFHKELLWTWIKDLFNA